MSTASVAPRPAAYPLTYQTVDDLEKGAGGTVEGDLSAALDVARQGFVRKTLGERGSARGGAADAATAPLFSLPPAAEGAALTTPTAQHHP